MTSSPNNPSSDPVASLASSSATYLVIINCVTNARSFPIREKGRTANELGTASHRVQRFVKRKSNRGKRRMWSGSAFPQPSRFVPFPGSGIL